MEFDDLDLRILRAATQCTTSRLTVEDVALLAKCSARTIYHRLQDTQFRSAFLEAHRNSLAAAVPEILDGFVREAKGGSFKHGKLILEIVGVYTEHKVVDGSINVHTAEKPFETDAERVAFANATLARLLSNEAEETDEVVN